MAGKPSIQERTPERFRQIQPVLAYAAEHIDEDVSLAALARHAGLSTFHLQRIFSAAAGETPKQLTLRLRLGRAAVMLLASHDSILDVALSCGFQSHEVFIRAFRRRFGIAPSAYRERGFVDEANAAQADRHAALVEQINPCVGLFYISGRENPGRSGMAYEIAKKQMAPQPVLVVRRRIKPSEVASTLGEALGVVFMHAQQNGLALSGQPFTRYIEWGPGVWTIEAGLPVAAHGKGGPPSEGGVRAEILPGGPAAVTTHAGPYDGLTAAHAAVQQWIEAQGLKAAGAPWEVYVTDPADFPDPKDWKTELFWPLAG
ncbi:MAG TPA: AraC family transcriptional regulator [Candidatus Acidoferrales bacterium]|jgi:AraC-like DNA-binding protein/effector-binding domain-containing protein|nr:AraC family transcriptional regulator [Candidatus Acidoferrales bacterium]